MWGKKAGLLSLDPKTDIVERKTDSNSSEFSFDFDSDVLSMPKSEDLFPPGYIVQFLGRWFDPTAEQSGAVTIADIPRATTFKRRDYFDATDWHTICLGTATLPETPVEHTNRSGSIIKHRFQPNRFGFLSTKSWSLSVQLLSKRKKDEERFFYLSLGPLDLIYCLDLLLAENWQKKCGRKILFTSTLIFILVLRHVP